MGYRVKSVRGTQFRIWATGILKEYMKKGFAMDDERLKGNGGGNYWKAFHGVNIIFSSKELLRRKRVASVEQSCIRLF
ncbi:MAG: RhuM family protein [Lachnospiraceae bacterium]